MRKDHIVEEVRRIRQELLNEAGGDLRSLVTWLTEPRKLREAAGVTHTNDKEHSQATDR